MYDNTNFYLNDTDMEEKKMGTNCLKNMSTIFCKPISQQNEEKSVASQNLMWSNTFKIFTDADSIVKKKYSYSI